MSRSYEQRGLAPGANLLPTAMTALAVGCLSAGAGACGDAERRETRSRPGGPPVCEEGSRQPAAEIEPELAPTGPSGNAIRRRAGAVWVVQSGSNTVGRFDLDAQSYDSDYVDLGSGRGPFGLAFGPEGTEMYVTNFRTDTVSVADTATGEVTREIDVDALDDPEGVAATEEWLYVTNVELEVGDDNDVSYGPGSVSILDRETFEVRGSVEAAFQNPQFARTIETPDGERVAISDSGAIRTPAEGPARVASDGGVELWRPNGRAEASHRESYRLEVAGESNRLGAPGRPVPTPDGTSLYFTSATAPVLFEFNLGAGEWERATDDPHRLYESDRNTLHHASMGPNGVLYVTAFNRDALYLFDTTCEETLAGPVDIGVSESMLEGPHGVALDPGPDETTAYFVMSVGHVMGRVGFRYGEK